MAKQIDLGWEPIPIGFFGDVHGCVGNLLEAIDGRPEVRHWFCTGDLVDMGRHVHDNAPAIRFLRERGIRSVRGNHDQVIINKHLFDYQDPEDREYLTTMPLDLEVTVCGITIRIFHATPHDLEEVVLDDTPDRTLAKTFEAHPADLYILGHSHKAFSREIGARRFVGPGYLGDVGGNPTFCVFTPCDSIRIETLPSAY